MYPGFHVIQVILKGFSSAFQLPRRRGGGGGATTATTTIMPLTTTTTALLLWLLFRLVRLLPHWFWMVRAINRLTT